MSRLSSLRAWTHDVKIETHALYFAVRDPLTPWFARALGACIVAYALSPIDLIPDFIPVLGLLDDVIIIPAGLWAVRRLIPAEVLAAAREKARTAKVRWSRTAAVVIVTIWVGAILLTGALVWQSIR